MAYIFRITIDFKKVFELLILCNKISSFCVFAYIAVKSKLTFCWRQRTLLCHSSSRLFLLLLISVYNISQVNCQVMARPQNSQSKIISFFIQIITLLLIFQANQLSSNVMKTYNNDLPKLVLIFVHKLLALRSILYYFQGFLGKCYCTLMGVQIFILPCHLPHYNTFIEKSASHINAINIACSLDRNCLIDNSESLLILATFAMITGFGIKNQRHKSGIVGVGVMQQGQVFIQICYDLLGSLQILFLQLQRTLITFIDQN